MAYNFPLLQNYTMGAGLKFDQQTILPPGGEIKAFVRHAALDGCANDVEKRRFTTLNAALAECRSGAGDIVMVLPGHAENISSADQMSNLVAGTQIYGCGYGTSRPTFTWTAATATFLLDVANVGLHNLNLNFDPGTGTTTVAAPITISGAGCRISNCKIRSGTDANSKVTIGITTTAAADDLVMDGNFIYGATAAEHTTVIQFVGADRLVFVNNQVRAATSNVAVGSVRFLTTASTDVTFIGNILQNKKASSTHALTGMAGLSGIFEDSLLMVGTGIAGFNTLGDAHIGAHIKVTDGNDYAVSLGVAAT